MNSCNFNESSVINNLLPFLLSTAKSPFQGSPELTIGLFFDGTGNNATNLQLMTPATESGSTCADAWGAKGEVSRCSYDNDYSLISRLYADYHQTTRQDIRESGTGNLQFGLYVGGVGTSTGQQDRVMDLISGEGGTGISAKSHEASLRIQQMIDGLAQAIPALAEAKLRLDIFGFSRGAASARHFANGVHAGRLTFFCDGPVSGSGSRRPLPCGIRFIGLFDTVVANNTIPLLTAGEGDIQLAMPAGISGNVFHITAMHECRENFPLTAVGGPWKEFSLPGAHADIGGGYLKWEFERHYLTRPGIETVAGSCAVNETRVYKNALRECESLRDYRCIGPILENTPPDIKTWTDYKVPDDERMGRRKRVGAAAMLCRMVSNGWAKASFMCMLDAARDGGLNFDGPGRSADAFFLPLPLEPLCDKAREQARQARASRPWEPFSADEINLIAAKHIHNSSFWNDVVVNGKGDIVNAASPFKSVGFVNRPADNWIRKVM